MSEFDRFEALTFDCYGTLIDWEVGILSALRPVLASHGTDLDDDLFAATARRLGVEPDWIVTAGQVGAYKPSRRIFEAALERIALPRTSILHVAQSLYHDIGPAREIGLATVWIDRRKDKSGFGATPEATAEADWKFSNLRALASAIDPTATV